MLCPIVFMVVKPLVVIATVSSKTMILLFGGSLCFVSYCIDGG